MADKPVGEVVAVDAVLDALESPTSSDVYEALGPYSDSAVAAVAAKRAAAAGGGSQPVIGQPKADDGTTYVGLPGLSAPEDWEVFLYDDPTRNGIVWYALLPVPVAITVDSVEVMVESAPVADTHIRLVISAADTDWQPTGAPLYQQVLTVPANSPQFTDIADADIGLALSAGLYLLALERDTDALSLNGRPASFAGAAHCGGSPPSSPIIGFGVTHTYGNFAALPRWDDADVFFAPDTPTTTGQQYPFLLGWH